MSPTFNLDDKVLCFNWAYLLGKPKVGEVVVLQTKERKVIKRIQKIDNRKVFVMGDNESESTDSREYGSVDLEKLIGRVVYVFKTV